YYAITYNAKVYLSPYTAEARANVIDSWLADHGVLLAILVPVGMWAATRPLAAAPRLRDVPRAYDDDGFVPTVGLGALAVVATANAALRDFMHYYVTAVPWCGLALGVLVDRALPRPRETRPLRAALLRTALLVPAMI